MSRAMGLSNVLRTSPWSFSQLHITFSIEHELSNCTGCRSARTETGRSVSEDNCYSYTPHLYIQRMHVPKNSAFPEADLRNKLVVCSRTAR